jgi:hypothetical protein
MLNMYKRLTLLSFIEYFVLNSSFLKIFSLFSAAFNK